MKIYFTRSFHVIVSLFDPFSVFIRLALLIQNSKYDMAYFFTIQEAEHINNQLYLYQNSNSPIVT